MSQDVQRPRHPDLASAFAGEKYTDAIGKRWHHVRRLLAKATKADRAG